MADMAISSLVKLLGDVVIEKVKSLHGVEGQVVLLKKELERMQAFLIDANKKQYEDQSVRQWISEIRELSHDAQDTIEMFLISVENKRNEGLLKKCISFPKCVKYLNRIGDEIASIIKKLEATKRSRDAYGIRDLGEAAAVSAAQVEVRRRQIEQQPVGLEDDERLLLEKSILNEEKRGLSIAVVVGMGGIGKSTLARKIYNHPDVVGGRFECRAWVVVSSEFTPQETIKQVILEIAGPEKEVQRMEIKKLVESTEDDLYLLEKLQQMLHQQLLEKTYFIVLDDVWEEEHWESLRDAFPTSQQDKRSRLLFTTRNSRLKKYGQYGHEMKFLNPNKSWELLLNKALVDGKCCENLEGVGRQILKKCNGLPLAISVVGGLLVGTQSKSAWEQVLGQINSVGIDESSIFSILELSYQNLSPRLKSCFLCLAFFKEDTIISVRRLTHIWVGQDLIQQEGRTRSEEIARSYLDELITRNLVQIKDFTLGCHVKKCQVHDLVHDVCLKKAKEEIGLEILKVQARNTSTSIAPRKSRHCVAYSGNMECFSLEHKRHLRSLFLHHEYCGSTDHEFRYCKRFQLLKILNLEWFGLNRLPSCFRTLIGLKYLKIKDVCTLRLPKWLEELKKLEVVDLRNQPVVFPKGELKMESLRYFRACYVSGELTSIKNWKSIETLKYIRANQWFICSLELIGSHPIRELGIDLDNLDYYPSMVQESLRKMENLVKLHLIWRTIACPIDLALFIPQVGSCLTKLVLVGSIIEFPSANVFPPKLSHLTLDKSQISEDSVTELGKLPNLISLKLSSEAYGGERMKILHDGFPNLEALSLIFITCLRGIDIEEGGMPHLTHLRLQECDALSTENLPKHITITNVDY